MTWPPDKKPASLRDIIPPLRVALDGAPYTGFQLDDTDPPPEGCDHQTAILQLAVQLGIEQGKRMFLRDLRRKLERQIRLQSCGIAPDLAEILEEMSQW